MEEVTPTLPAFGTGKRELRLLTAVGVLSVLLADFVLYGGFCLGFALTNGGLLIAAVWYLLASGRKLKPYPAVLLGLSLVICASFVRSNDGFVKFVMVCFLLVAENLGLCLLAGQNRRGSGGITSLLDAPRTVFVLGFGKIDMAFRGLTAARKSMGKAGKSRTAILLGLALAVPVAAVVIALLISADAAFEGVFRQLPQIRFGEIFISLLLGGMLACFVYTKNVALCRSEAEPKAEKKKKVWEPLTVNTVLIVVCAVYGVYLVSQIAYFVGGFAGVLPEGYTVAQYARRGFFEMAALCAINLAMIATAVGLTRPAGEKAPALTRGLCVAVGLVTLFFVAAASAKMVLYIRSFGMTRLRVLTEVIMLFLGIATVFVGIWLFAPKFSYMKGIVTAALLLGAAVTWADVDTVVAAYNVNAYQQGVLDTVDVEYLAGLSDGVIPYLEELSRDENEKIAMRAAFALESRGSEGEDLRGWYLTRKS